MNQAIRPAQPTYDARYYRIVALPFALAAIAYPAVSLLAPQYATLMLAGCVPLCALLIGLQFPRMGWPTLWLLALAATYAVNGLSERGIVHTVALVATACMFLMFSIYGDDLLDYADMPLFIFIAVAAAIVLAPQHLNENAAGATIVYSVAILCVMALRQPDANSKRIAAAFFAAGIGVAVFLNFRAMMICAAVFLIAYLCSVRMKPKTYRLAGLAIIPAMLFAAVWFFTNIFTSPLAITIAEKVEEYSGMRTNSGRDYLWPRLLSATEENQLFGLGSGVLPRDVMSTQLSSHNYFLQTYLQVGLVGVVFLALFLWSVWSILSMSTSTASGRFGSALFLMFVVHNMTEVVMFQNLTTAAVPAWIAIGLAIALNYRPAEAQVTPIPAPVRLPKAV